MIEVDIIVSEEVNGLFALDAERLKKFMMLVLRSNGITKCTVSVIFIDDVKMSELNERYKKRKGTTDVLSFNLSDNGRDEVEGEVYISLERAKEQSVDYGVSVSEEIIRLVTHGLLHLAGWVHNSEKEYETMTRETEHFVASFFGDGG